MKRQRGIVLVIALILLAVMSISAVAAFRSTLTSGTFSANLRTQDQALQAAEAALRYCEAQIALQDPIVKVQPILVSEEDKPAPWEKLQEWDRVASNLPAAIAGSAQAAPEFAPQCLIEEMVLPRPKGGYDEFHAYLVTARGFSNDYRRSAWASSAGAEAWLQSVVHAIPPTPPESGTENGNFTL